MAFGGLASVTAAIIVVVSVAITIVAADYVAAAMRLKRPNIYVNENLKN
jgi:hypothetical protein